MPDPPDCGEHWRQPCAECPWRHWVEQQLQFHQAQCDLLSYNWQQLEALRDKLLALDALWEAGGPEPGTKERGAHEHYPDALETIQQQRDSRPAPSQTVVKFRQDEHLMPYVQHTATDDNRLILARDASPAPAPIVEGENATVPGWEPPAPAQAVPPYNPDEATLTLPPGFEPKQAAREDGWPLGPHPFSKPWKQQAAPPAPSPDDIFIRHIAGHLEDGQEVVCKVCGRTAESIIREAPPAPQQPRSCDKCGGHVFLIMSDSVVCPVCGWQQPRQGGGGL